MLLPLLESLLTTPLTDATRTQWRADADGFFEHWPANLAALSSVPPALDEETAARVLYAIDAAIVATERHVSPRPGHGSTHLRRLLSWALGIAHNDGLDRLDAIRLLLAAAYADLGWEPVPIDSAALHHACASAVIFDRVAAQIGLPPAVMVPVRYAILAHSAERPDFDESLRVVDDVRTTDKLDALGGTGLVRALASFVFDPGIPFLPEGGSAAQPSVLWGWWRVTSNLFPIKASAYGRDCAEDAVDWGYSVLDEAIEHTDASHDITSILFGLILAVEGPAPEDCYDRLDARMRDLPSGAYHRWGQIFEETRSRLVDEEMERTRVRDLAQRTGDPLFIGVVRLLEEDTRSS
jgi:hypothetical protein